MRYWKRLMIIIVFVKEVGELCRGSNRMVLLQRQHIHFCASVWRLRFEHHLTVFVYVIVIGQRINALKPKSFDCLGRIMTGALYVNHLTAHFQCIFSKKNKISL